MMNRNDEIDIIIPVALELDWPTAESIISDIKEQHELYGFNRFALSGPCGGHRSTGFPPIEVFKSQAKLFLKVKNALLPYGIDCGWWITATLKSGPSKEFTMQIKGNGEKHPFSNCPLDESFVRRFCDSVALFAKIAKPSFIITEDDFSIGAAQGCFCERHLEELSKRLGRYYSRQELVNIIDSPSYNDQKALEITRMWRNVLRDSLVHLASEIRKAVDKESPEIPIGYMQPGSSDSDGDCTYAVAKALAGANHTPFSRLYGAFYGGAVTKGIPLELYHALYSKQHINSDFIFYHESDTFPHTRFFTSGNQMRAIMTTVYSYGFDGSTFQTQQLLDNPNEEKAFGKMFKKECKRFNEIRRIAKGCRLCGVQIPYSPFDNTVDKTKSSVNPLWVNCISRFGIPYTTLPSEISFWDDRQAKFKSDAEIKDALSKNLFLDGDAARVLCERGYGEYLGVSIGNDVTLGNRLSFDLGAREIIRDEFLREGDGKNMPSAHMYSPAGNGRLLKMTVTDEKCEVISELYTFKGELISPAMTRFQNSLGGKAVVFGITLEGNRSQSLLNYRRQRLLGNLLEWCDCDNVRVLDEPEIFIIENRAVGDMQAELTGMLTLINLGEDSIDSVSLYLPSSWRGVEKFSYIDQDAKIQPLEFERTEKGIIVKSELSHLSTLCIIGK